MTPLLIYIIIHVIGIIPTYLVFRTLVKHYSSGSWTNRDRFYNILGSVVCSVAILGLFLAMAVFFGFILGILWIITSVGDMIDWDKPVNW